ncbi:polysaccharide deacetylase family protein [Micromonospora sp. NPDC048999]|uniref:polysaccharide deacetylase family protein n=1 Tax=Micromonospora sp. NPDC048999 TaxID=3155391 RepID=UPI0033F7FC6F
MTHVKVSRRGLFAAGALGAATSTTAIANLASDAPLSPASKGKPMIGPSFASGWRDVSSIVTSMQAGHGWTTTGTIGGANLNDSAVFVRGSQSASITTNGAGATATLRRFGLPAINLTGKALRLLLRVDNYTQVNTLNFMVGTSSLVNNFKWRFNANTSSSQIGMAGDWVAVTLHWSEINTAAGAYTLSPTGAPSTTSGFTDLQIQVADKGTGPVSLWLQAVEIIDSAVSTWPKGIISITFDDSNDSARLAMRKMDTLGFRGTQYTIADAIGTPDMLTLAELRSLQAMSGWEIAGHSYTSLAHATRYPNLTAQQVDDDARSLKEWLVSNGFHGDSFAYPGGRYENTVDGVPVDQLVARYFGSARTILSEVGVSTHVALDAIPAAMPYRMRALSSVSSLSPGPNNPTKLTATGGMLDKVASNGGWLNLVFHQIVTGAPTDPAEITQTDFNLIMDAIAAREIPVIPVSDVVRRAGV